MDVLLVVVFVKNLVIGFLFIRLVFINIMFKIKVLIKLFI